MRAFAFMVHLKLAPNPRHSAVMPGDSARWIDAKDSLSRFVEFRAQKDGRSVDRVENPRGKR